MADHTNQALIDMVFLLRMIREIQDDELWGTYIKLLLAQMEENEKEEKRWLEESQPYDQDEEEYDQLD